MDRDAFWSLLDRTRAGTDHDSGAHEEALREALRQTAPADLIDFERHASALLGQSYRNALWGAAYLVNGGCSDDGFDYFRGWLIAQGREVYEAALANPDSLAEYPGLGEGDVELEGLWYVARQEYARATGSEMADDVGGDEEDNVEEGTSSTSTTTRRCGRITRSCSPASGDGSVRSRLGRTPRSAPNDRRSLGGR